MVSLAPRPRPPAPRRFLDNMGRPTFHTVGMPRAFWRDVYHLILQMRWTTFLLAALVLYFSSHLVFALLYWLQPGSIGGASDGSFLSAYFFSVQTMMTIGYGGMMPATMWANWVVTFEAFLGLLITAMLTGLVFAKFSKPSAAVLWSKAVCVSNFDGAPTLMLRMANARGNRIVEASLTLTAGLTTLTREGHPFRKLHDLKLVRSSSPLFSVSWQAMHTIDASSPLFGQDSASLANQSLEIMAVLSGIDETSSQSVHSRYSYVASDIRWNAKFVDILSAREDGTRLIDYTKFHDTEFASGAAASTAPPYDSSGAAVSGTGAAGTSSLGTTPDAARDANEPRPSA